MLNLKHLSDTGFKIWVKLKRILIYQDKVKKGWWNSARTTIVINHVNVLQVTQ